MAGKWGLAIAALLATAQTAYATTVCYPREQILNMLARDYAAEKHSQGVLRPHSVMEMWISQKNDDWIIVTTDLNGSSCIIAYGEMFTEVQMPDSHEPG